MGSFYIYSKVEAKTDKQVKVVENLITHLKEHDFDAYQNMTDRVYVPEIEFLNGFSSSSEEGIYTIEFEPQKSFDFEDFYDFFKDIGLPKVEFWAWSSNSGEYCFCKDGDFEDYYPEINWRWLELPEDYTELEGLKIVFTGKMKNGTRDEMEERAEEYGAIVQKSVNSKTHMLVTGEKVGESKLNKAKQNNVQIVDEEFFWEIVE